MVFRPFLIAIASVILAACNPIANYDQGGEEVERWHRLYSENDGDRLWGMTGEKFREVTTREEFDDLLTVVNARLGKVTSTDRGGFNVNSQLGGTTTVITMNTEFEQGSGQEVFTFLGKGEDMELVGWTVNSQRLTLTAADLELPERAASETAGD